MWEQSKQDMKWLRQEGEEEERREETSMTRCHVKTNIITQIIWVSVSPNLHLFILQVTVHNLCDFLIKTWTWNHAAMLTSGLFRELKR